MEAMPDERCALCERDVPFLTDHHVIPKSRGGKELIAICRDCHRQLHALFDNKTLERQFNNIKAIMEDDNFCKYLKWVRKRPFGVVHKAKRARARERGRRD